MFKRGLRILGERLFISVVFLLLIVLLGAVIDIIRGRVTTCELVIDNRGASPLLNGTVFLDRERSAKRQRTLPTIPGRTRVTFELEKFYPESGSTLSLERVDGSSVNALFGYIDVGEVWRYKLVVTEDASSFQGEKVRREDLRVRP